MEMIVFIGLGSMGGSLLKGLLGHEAFSPKKVLISTRTKEKIKCFMAPFVFDDLLEATLNKHKKVKSNMDRLFD
jgi:pyrroline-5-carboxylate reductase